MAQQLNDGNRDADIREVVEEALDNAQQNGYSVLTDTCATVASDLIDYCWALEQCSVKRLMPFVAAWQKAAKGKL